MTQSGDTNPYTELIVNNAEEIEPLLAQMEQWSILSNMLNYIEHDKLPQNFHKLGISAVNNLQKQFSYRGRECDRGRLWSITNVLREEYLDGYT